MRERQRKNILQSAIKKIYIRYHGVNIVSVRVDDKKYIIYKNKPIITTDAKLLEEASKHKFLKIEEPNDKEVKEWIIDPDSLPFIKKLLDSKDLDVFKWVSDNEPKVVDHLVKNGYLIAKRDKEESLDSIIKYIESKGYTVSKNEDKNDSKASNKEDDKEVGKVKESPKKASNESKNKDKKADKDSGKTNKTKQPEKPSPAKSKTTP